MGLVKRAALYALPVFFMASAFTAQASNQILAAAKQAQLWQQPYWHKLLHYQPKGNGYASLAGGQRLFVSEHGASDPRAELLATLEALLTNQFLSQRDEAALCAFPARLRWFKQVLHLSDADFPEQQCEQRERWRKELNPQSATLVFPDAYISSPGSMFGHTLLRVNGAKTGARAGLLAYAVNYAADVRGVGAVEYAVKGITGGFPGFFGLFPYYTKVKEYAWIEHRDLWEYPLNLNELELTRLLEHLWELKLVPFRYFFFNQNCSWQLLALLEIARPGATLSEGFDWYAIPVDTVRRLQDEGLVVDEPVLRPSRQRALDAIHQRLPSQQKTWVAELVTGQRQASDPFITELPLARQREILDAAYELLHAKYRRGDFARDEALPRAHRLLRARSALGVAETESLLTTENLTSPDQAHESARWGLSVGDDELGSWLGLNFRPAFHDLLDPDAGFLPGYGIDFGKLELRQYLSPDKLRLESLSILSASSRNVWTSWSKPASWNLHFGFSRPAWLRGVDADPRLGFNLGGEMGLAFGSGRSHLFVGAAVDAHWGALLDRDGRLALGPMVSIKSQLTDSLSAMFSYQQQYAVAGLKIDAATADLGLHWQFDANQGLRLSLQHADIERAADTRSIGLGWLQYF